MKDTQAIVQRVRKIDGGIKQIELWVDKPIQEIKPGQSLLVRPRHEETEPIWHPYLREQWWPVRFAGKNLVIELETHQVYNPGDVFDALGPVGRPFRFRRSLHNVMLLAYDTLPVALLMTIHWLLGNNLDVTLVLLGEARRYPTQHLPPEVEVIRGGDDENKLDWPDQVTAVGLADQVFAVVPQSDEFTHFAELWNLFNERRNNPGKNYLFGVFRSIMPCGVGACEACMVRTRDGSKLACMDGPAFDLHQVMTR